MPIKEMKKIIPKQKHIICLDVIKPNKKIQKYYQ